MSKFQIKLVFHSFLFEIRTDSVDTSHDTMLAAMTAELEQLLASVS